jgi:hypothetical protein
MLKYRVTEENFSNFGKAWFGELCAPAALFLDSYNLNGR